MASRQNQTFKKISLVYGKDSVGHFLNNQNIPCIPSDQINFFNCHEFTDEGCKYFDGGYITSEYGCVK